MLQLVMISADNRQYYLLVVHCSSKHDYYSLCYKKCLAPFDLTLNTQRGLNKTMR